MLVAVLPAMILCAGLGTRLRPLSDERAKPLVPVGDRAALAHVLDRVRRGGASRVVINTYHRVEDLRAFLAESAPGVAVSEESELLGTGGGLSHAHALLGEGDVLVWNGDILADIDVGSLLETHAAHGPSVRATLVVAPRAAGEGNVGIDARGHIVRLRRETVRGGEVEGGDFVGVHVLGAALRASLPERGGLVEDVWLPAMHSGAALAIHRHVGSFADIGTIASYFEANERWLDARGLDAWVGERAHVGADVRVVRSIVGAGAVVAGTGAVERCVVWPGARVVAPLAGAVVTPRTLVRL
jgi:mannose-1-phosphate guanylyltransferase